MSPWDPPIRGQPCLTSSASPSPRSCSRCCGTAPRQARRRPWCWALALSSPSPFSSYSSIWSPRRGNPSCGVSRWCHGFHPFPSSSIYSCWVPSTGHPISGSDSFRGLQWLCMCYTVSMLALMLGNRTLLVKRILRWWRNIILMYPGTILSKYKCMCNGSYILTFLFFCFLHRIEKSSGIGCNLILQHLATCIVWFPVLLDFCSISPKMLIWSQLLFLASFFHTFNCCTKMLKSQPQPNSPHVPTGQNIWKM